VTSWPVDFTQSGFGAPPPSGAAVSAHRVDIILSDGRRILVEGSTALSAVLGLVQGDGMIPVPSTKSIVSTNVCQGPGSQNKRREQLPRTHTAELHIANPTDASQYVLVIQPGPSWPVG